MTVVLVEATHVPAVIEMQHAPLVAVTRAAPVLVDGEIVDRPLPIDPAGVARHLFAHVVPAEPSAHRQPALKVRVRPFGAEKHHLPAEVAATERSRGTLRIDLELQGHACAMVVDT